MEVEGVRTIDFQVVKFHIVWPGDRLYSFISKFLEKVSLDPPGSQGQPSPKIH